MVSRPPHDDRTSGSGRVARGFLDGLERWLASDRSPDGPSARAALLEVLREAQAAQPSMALVHQLAARALAVADTSVARGDRAADLRQFVLESCAAERRDLEKAVADGTVTHDEARAVREAARELRPRGHAAVLEGRDLGLQLEGVEHHAVADQAARAGVQDARGHQVQYEGLALVDHASDPAGPGFAERRCRPLRRPRRPSPGRRA